MMDPGLFPPQEKGVLLPNFSYKKKEEIWKKWHNNTEVHDKNGYMDLVISRDGVLFLIWVKNIKCETWISLLRAETDRQEYLTNLFCSVYPIYFTSGKEPIENVCKEETL